MAWQGGVSGGRVAFYSFPHCPFRPILDVSSSPVTGYDIEWLDGLFGCSSIIKTSPKQFISMIQFSLMMFNPMELSQF